jgi:ribulose-phosphate 3-epimerase
MAEVIPAIIGADFKEVKHKLDLVEGLVSWAQLDIMDGFFAPSYSWATPDDLEQLHGKIKLEAHLMIEEPEEFIASWSGVVDRILVHVESTERLEDIIKQLQTLPIQLGLVLLAETPVEVLDPYLDRIKHVQLMAIDEIGFHGHPFNPEVINRVKAIREKHPDVTIAVDGGVSLVNAPALLAAGVNNLVVGSAIWNSNDINKTIKQFQNL